MAALIWERRGRISLALMLMALAAIAGVQMGTKPAHATSGGSAYVTPDIVNVSNDPTIVETTIKALPEMVDLGGNLQASVLTFNGSIPGPTFRLTVGQTVIVHFENHIAHQTGIHWHGIELNNHSDGTPITQDQVLPNGTFIYKFKVTRPGVFWYHPHHHSSTNQVFKGLYGLIIVTDPVNEPFLVNNNIIPGPADTLQMVLSDLTVCKQPGQNDTVTYDTNKIPFHHIFFADPMPKQGGSKPKDLCEAKPNGSAMDEDGGDKPQSFNAGDVPNIQKGDSTGGPVNEGQTVLTNGRQVGFRQGRPIEGVGGPGALDGNAETYVVKQGQGLRLQMLNAATTRFFRLRLTTNEGAQVPLVKIGGQGGFLNKAVIEGGVNRITGYDTKFTSGELLLDPGDRADAVAVIPADADGTLTLWTEDFQRAGNGAGSGGSNFTGLPTVPVAHFQVSGSVQTPYSLSPGDNLLLANNTQVEVLGNPTGNLLDPTQFGQAGMSDPDIQLTNSTNPNLSINGKIGIHDDPDPSHDYTEFPYADSARMAVIGQTLELTVTNETPNAHHPFHLHGFSMQPRTLELNNSVVYTYPTEFRDNIDVPPLHTLRFRIRLDDRPMVDGVTPGGALGRWVFHCHIFFHATFGMLSEFDVVKNGLQKPHITVIDRVKWLNPGDPVEVRGTFAVRPEQSVRFTASLGTIVQVGDIVNGKGQFLWSHQVGGTHTGGGLIGGAALLASVDTAPIVPQSQLVYLTITDTEGNADQAAFQLDVNQPPVVTVRNTAGVEGGPIPLTGTAVDPEGSPIAISTWTLTPGAGVDPGATCTIADRHALSTTATCTDDGPFVATLTASDGFATGSASGAVTVANAPPVAVITSPVAGTQFLAGDPVAVVASFTDAGSNDTHTCAINWGDGTTTPGTLTEGFGSCSGTHTYTPKAGTQTIAVTVTDDDGGVGTAQVPIVIFTARSLKKDALAKVRALEAHAPRPTAEHLDKIAREIEDSLDDDLWESGNALDARRGEKVFEREEKAVDDLVDLGRRVRDLPLQPIIDDLVNADAILADRALTDAINRHGIPREIAEGQAWLARAGAARAAGRWEQAIESYEHAWEESIEALTRMRHHTH